MEGFWFHLEHLFFWKIFFFCMVKYLSFFNILLLPEDDIPFNVKWQGPKCDTPLVFHRVVLCSLANLLVHKDSKSVFKSSKIGVHPTGWPPNGKTGWCVCGCLVTPAMKNHKIVVACQLPTYPFFIKKNPKSFLFYCFPFGFSLGQRGGFSHCWFP